MTTASALPNGVYTKYKRATRFFLDWLLRASQASSSSSSSRLSSLESFHGVVDAIARAPAAQLSPALLHQLPRALAACQAAITLRERRGDDAHAHFLKKLKSWLAILQRVDVGNASGTKPATTKGAKSKKQTPKRTEEADSARFSNYYEVLRLPDDYFADATDLADDIELAQQLTSAAHIGETKSKPSARDKLFDEAFDQDLHMELACLLVEMEEMADQVYETYREVKRETRTLVEATTAAYAAMLLVESRVAALQLRYPSIRVAQDVLTLLGNRATLDLPDRLVSALNRMAHSNTIEHMPGLFLADYVWVASALATFTSAIPADKNKSIILKDGYFGEHYDEEKTPHYMLPDLSSVSPFFMQQLPLLYNTLAANRLRSSKTAKMSLQGGIWSLIDEYFTTQKVGIPVVFACICWIKSVTALQGNGGLRRHVSLAISHSWEVEKRLRVSVAKGHVGKADRDIQDAMEAMLKDLEARRRQLSKGSAIGLLRANPILAGSTMLGQHVRFLQFGGEAVLVTSRLRAFLHLYCALIDRQLLKKIPFFEDLLAVYGDVMFTPSRAAAVHGSCCRIYLLSSHLTVAAVDALFRGAPAPPKHAAAKVRDCYHLRDLSSAFRLFSEHDLSVVAPKHESLPVKDQLQRVSDQCAEELLKTRVLSRDLLKLNDDMTDLFESLCDGLGRRWYHEEYLSKPEPGVSRQYMVNRALEDAVMVPLMPFLDCLELDGSIDTAKLLRIDTVKTSRVNDDAIAQYCRRAADIVHRQFGAKNATTIESTYFMLPPYTDSVSREFGNTDFKRDTKNPSRAEQFSEIMDILEDATGPLSATELAQIKRLVKADPSLLVLSSAAKPLPMILHHAAAGVVHDAALVEWLIQMGALYWQPSVHYREGRAAEWMDASMLPNQLPVHSAAAAGHNEIVMLLLEAENMRDLNTKTFQTKDTLAHLAVKNGHRELFKLLVTLGADVRDRNASGQRVSDLTSDKDWKRELVTTIIEQVRTFGDVPHQSRDALFRQQQQQQAEMLIRAMAAQRDQERVAQRGTSGTKNKSMTKAKKK